MPSKSEQRLAAVRQRKRAVERRLLRLQSEIRAPMGYGDHAERAAWIDRLRECFEAAQREWRQLLADEAAAEADLAAATKPAPIRVITGKPKASAPLRIIAARKPKAIPGQVGDGAPTPPRPAMPPAELIRKWMGPNGLHFRNAAEYRAWSEWIRRRWPRSRRQR